MNAPLDLRAVEARLLAGIPKPYANPKFQQWADVTALLAHTRALRALVDEAERILGQRALWYDKATDMKVCDFCGGSWEPGPEVRDAEHEPRCPYADWRERATALLGAAQDGPA